MRNESPMPFETFESGEEAEHYQREVAEHLWIQRHRLAQITHCDGHEQVAL
jgi:hypothetical protein